MKRKKFVMDKAVNGEWFFKLVASNGQVLMTSETYSTKQQMIDTLDTLVGKSFPKKVEDATA